MAASRPETTKSVSILTLDNDLIVRLKYYINKTYYVFNHNVDDTFFYGIYFL